MKDILWIELEEIDQERLRVDEDLTDEEFDKLCEKDDALEQRAKKELAWFFGKLGGKVANAGSKPQSFRRAEAIRGWLATLPAFHQGALALRFTPKKWPKAVEDKFGHYASLVVRLECTKHPSKGNAAEVEEAAAKRIEEAIAEKRSVGDLDDRARAHVNLALRAYLKAQGKRRTVRPSRAARKPPRPVALAGVDAQNSQLPSACSPANDLEVEGPPSSSAGGLGS